MLQHTKELFPNRKPKFIITDKHQNPQFKKSDPNSAAIYVDRLIYIDQNHIDNPNYFIHEFAHFVVDLIPKQSEPMLDAAYKQMLDFYFKRAKVKQRPLQPTTKHEDPSITDKFRQKVSAKLGFPQYGLMNRDEFFAVLIENWHKLPTNAVTYRYKQLVKGILARL
jgi:hypothetical protein